MSLDTSNPVYEVGDTRITRIVDQTLDHNTAAQLYLDWRYSAVAPYRNTLVPCDLAADNTHLNQSVHGWLVQDRGTPSWLTPRPVTTTGVPTIPYSIGARIPRCSTNWPEPA